MGEKERVELDAQQWKSHATGLEAAAATKERQSKEQLDKLHKELEELKVRGTMAAPKRFPGSLSFPAPHGG